MLAAASAVSVAGPEGRGGGGRGASGGLLVSGGRRGRGPGHAGALGPRRREEEGAVVGVLVQVGVVPPGLGRLGRRAGVRAAGRLC